MALENMGFKDQNWSHFGKEKKTEEERRRGRGREEEEKPSKPRYGTLDFCMETNLDYDSMRLYMNFHAWLVSSLSPNLGFC